MAERKPSDERPQELRFELSVIELKQVLVDPAVDADLVTTALLDRRHHLRVQHRAHRWDVERRRERLPIEELEDAR